MLFSPQGSAWGNKKTRGARGEAHTPDHENRKEAWHLVLLVADPRGKVASLTFFFPWPSRNSLLNRSFTWLRSVVFLDAKGRAGW